MIFLILTQSVLDIDQILIWECTSHCQMPWSIHKFPNQIFFNSQSHGLLTMNFNQDRKPRRLKMNITFAFLIHIWHFKKLFGMLDSIAKNGSFATTNRKSSLGFFMQEGERRAMFLICLGLLASGAWEPSTKETWAQGPFLSCNSTLFAILLGQSQGNRRTNKLLLLLAYNKKFAAL